MRNIRIILFICTVGATCLYIIYPFYNVDRSDLIQSKPTQLMVPRLINSTTVKTKIYPTYYDEDLHVDWPFIINKNYHKSELRQWIEPMKLGIKNPNGIGEDGAGYIPTDDMKQNMNELLKEHRYNLLASNMISIHRSLPDPRSYECQNLSYPENLPTASIIIIFHNEAWTMLFRTIWSVLDRSPPELIEEIILVDDLSTWPISKRPLDDYIELLPARIKIIRTSKREGLIRARLIGAKYATILHRNR